MQFLTESTVESAALGWQVACGPDIAPDMPLAERRDCREVLLAQRVRDALLSKLIKASPNNSGELRVKDAEKFIAEATA